MLIALTTSAVLAMITVLITYEVLKIVGTLRKHYSLPRRIQLLLLVGGSIVAHLISISLFAVAYALMSQHLGLGTLSGELDGGAWDYVYFSVVCYTTLGFGEVYATGPMRITAALEGLNGLALITWSASFAYASTADLWDRE